MAPLTRFTKAQLQESLGHLAAENLVMRERIGELEQQLVDPEWVRLTDDGHWEFSRDGLKSITRLARLMYLKNPAIQRGVNIQRDYVFGQEVTIQAEDADVDEVVQAFLDDAKNQVELTSHRALLDKEVELALLGNLFFVFFVRPADGRVRVRTLPADEIEEIVSNPEDAKEPWYYKRVWTERKLDLASGNLGEPVVHTVYYPDWRYQPATKPAKIGEGTVAWDAPVFHVRAGGLPGMRFGVPEVYAALDWARAYKSFLEDWATIVRAYARFAWKVTTKGGATGITAARNRLATTLAAGSGETNPQPPAGSAFVASAEGGADLQPVRTAGATTAAEDGRRLLLMVAATFGFPETFWGDTDVGTLATAKSLDRPSELKIVSRQALWRGVLKAILNFVVYHAVRAGQLDGTAEPEDDGTPSVELAVDPETGEPRSQAVEVIFPPVVEHAVTETVGAIVEADKVLGRQGAKNLSRLLLSAIGVDDVEAALDELYDEDGNPTRQPVAPIAPPGGEPEDDDAAEDEEESAVLEAVRHVARYLRDHPLPPGDVPVKENGHVRGHS